MYSSIVSLNLPFFKSILSSRHVRAFSSSTLCISLLHTVLFSLAQILSMLPIPLKSLSQKPHRRITPSKFSAIFNVPSIYLPVFMDDHHFFTLPSMFSAVFMDDFHRRPCFCSFSWTTATFSPFRPSFRPFLWMTLTAIHVFARFYGRPSLFHLSVHVFSYFQGRFSLSSMFLPIFMDSRAFFICRSRERGVRTRTRAEGQQAGDGA